MQDILLMVGPYGDWIKHDLEERTVLVSECDGVRLISAEKHELLSRVPDSLVDVFKIGSTAPGTLLTATSCISVTQTLYPKQQLLCSFCSTVLLAALPSTALTFMNSCTYAICVVVSTQFAAFFLMSDGSSSNNTFNCLY